jgi:hypothetical protein
MADVVKHARQAYGANLARFNRDFIVPQLVTRGLLEERRVLFLTHYKRTAAGDAEESRIAADIARARTIPELIRSNPAEAAAIVLAVGSTILLVGELRPYYRQISEAMRPPPGTGGADSGGGDASPMLWDSSKPAGEHGGALPSHEGAQMLDAASLGNLDLSSFDAGAFDALDAGMASFDAGFDASVGDGGGGDGGGGDGGGGGGGD